MSNSKIVSKTLSKLHFIIRKIQNSVLARSLSTIFTKNVKRSLFRRLTPIVTFLHNNCKSLIMRTLRTIIHIRIMPFNFHYSIFVALKTGFPQLFSCKKQNRQINSIIGSRIEYYPFR